MALSPPPAFDPDAPDPEPPRRSPRIQGVPNPHKVDELILTLVDILEDESVEYEALCHAEAEADADYQRGYLTTLEELKHTVAGSIDSKEKMAKLANIEAYQKRVRAEGQAKGKLVYIQSLGKKIEALRTVAANYRHQTMP